MGLLRDAHQVLTGAGLTRPEEVAAACVRSAADALLDLPGAPVSVGLKPAAKDLLTAVDALPPPAAPADSPGRGDPARQSRTQRAAWEQATAAAEVLRGELERPGGFHRARARGIVERLMGVTLGAAQETALDVWSTVYAVASGILHGRSADPGEAVTLYTQLLRAARELLVPLPARAARVLELAALQHPGAEEAVELAGWADPRATGYFFRSRPAAAWLPVLHEHAPHLLLADEETGLWPAAPFLEHLAAVDPDTARRWLEDHAVQLAAAGPGALIEVLLRALDGTLTAADVRLLLPYILVPVRDGEPVERAGWPRGLTARWAGLLPVTGRDRDWVLVVEALLRDVVDSGTQAFEAMMKRPHGVGSEQPPAAALREMHSDPEVEAEIERTWAVLLAESDVVGLLREFVKTVHGQDGDGSTFRSARTVRAALAGLLCRSVEVASASAIDRVDLDEVRLEEERVIFQADVLGPFLGPLLARAVLDLAAADAKAGLPLAERVRAWKRIDTVDTHLHDRMLAAHLATHPPLASTDAAGAADWWDWAARATARLLAVRPTPEGARLAAAVLRDCPPKRAAGLEQRVRSALGPAPDAHEVEKTLLEDADQVDSPTQPLASWLRVWAWSPVLPAVLLAEFAPLLAALRRLTPDGPPDPRVTARPRPRTMRRHHTALDVESLLELTAQNGPLAAAAALAAAEDAGADGYARVLQRLVGADPAAWTADLPRLLAALGSPVLGAFYLTATARVARRPGAVAPQDLASAAVAALTLRRSLPAPSGQQPSTAVVFADRALSDLLHAAWRTDADPAADLPAILDHLHRLTEPLTRPLGPPSPAGHQPAPTAAHAGDGAGGGEDAAVRALDCLLEYAASRATADGQMPGHVLQLVADVLAARSRDETVAKVIGAHLPVLHYRASTFTAAHPDLYTLDPHRPSPAAAWLEDGRPDPLLLAALDSGQLLAALRDKPMALSIHVVDALLDGHHDLLGDPVAAWRAVATGPGGDKAASWLFMTLAILKPRRFAHAHEDVAHVWWQAALDAGLPSGALAGAGHFSNLALPETVWLSLARRSAEHTPAQENAAAIAERAAAHPRHPDALLLTVHLLTCPASDTRYGAELLRHARTLVEAATALPAGERPAETEQLRRALVEAGEVDIART